MRHKGNHPNRTMRGGPLAVFDHAPRQRSLGMTVPTKERPARSDAKLQELIALIEGADSVELKLTLPDSDQRSTITALALDPLDAQIRQAFFFDTPDLTLNERGVVVRARRVQRKGARRVQRKGDDSVVKLRPVVPGDLPDDIRSSAAFGVEVDASPQGFVCSGSMKGVPGSSVRDAVRGTQPLRKLFSKEQRAFFAEHAPDGIEIDDLKVLGPIFVLKLKYSPEELGRRLVAEVWLYPDNTRILELSTKCAPSEAFQ